MKMQFIVCFVAFVSVLGLSAAGAQSLPSHKTLQMKMSGDRGWTLECTFEREGDDPLSRRLRGGGDVEAIVLSRVTGGSCAYTGPTRRGALKITFTDENFPEKCPFAIENEACVGRFAVGSSGSFTF